MNVNIRTIENGSIVTGRFPHREQYFATDEELLAFLKEHLQMMRAAKKESVQKEDDE